MCTISGYETVFQGSGQSTVDHFEDILEMIDIGKGGHRQVADVRLSRYACYLIVQNGDPSKPVIANGQTCKMFLTAAVFKFSRLHFVIDSIIYRILTKKFVAVA